MRLTPELLEDLDKLGLTGKQMAGVLKLFTSHLESKNQSARDRQRRWRERSRNVTVDVTETPTVDVTVGVTHNGEGSPPFPSLLSPPAPPYTTHPNPPLQASAPRRATRLNPDLPLDPKWRKWAVDYGFPASRVEKEFESFRDYWCGLGGKAALKADWEATWRNRIRSSMDRMPKLASSDTGAGIF